MGKHHTTSKAGSAMIPKEGELLEYRYMQVWIIANWRKQCPHWHLQGQRKTLR